MDNDTPMSVSERLEKIPVQCNAFSMSVSSEY